jgi:hypothetical protein
MMVLLFRRSSLVFGVQGDVVVALLRGLFCERLHDRNAAPGNFQQKSPHSSWPARGAPKIGTTVCRRPPLWTAAVAVAAAGCLAGPSITYQRCAFFQWLTRYNGIAGPAAGCLFLGCFARKENTAITPNKGRSVICIGWDPCFSSKKKGRGNVALAKRNEQETEQVILAPANAFWIGMMAAGTYYHLAGCDRQTEDNIT